MRALSIVAFLAAAFGAFVAYATYWVSCYDEIGGSSMCPQGEPTATMIAQLVVALVGLLPPLAMILFAFRDNRRAAVAALVSGVILWAFWAVLDDAAVHGWDADMRLALTYPLAAR